MKKEKKIVYIHIVVKNICTKMYAIWNTFILC